MGSPENCSSNESKDMWASSWLTNSYQPSTTTIQKLKQIFLKDLRLGLHHRGCYVLVQINPCFPFSGGMVAVGDEKGNFAGVRIVYQDGKRIYNQSWGYAKFLIIKEPFYLAISRSSMGLHHISSFY